MKIFYFYINSIFDIIISISHSHINCKIDIEINYSHQVEIKNHLFFATVLIHTQIISIYLFLLQTLPEPLSYRIKEVFHNGAFTGFNFDTAG